MHALTACPPWQVLLPNGLYMICQGVSVLYAYPKRVLVWSIIQILNLIICEALGAGVAVVLLPLWCDHAIVCHHPTE